MHFRHPIQRILRFTTASSVKGSYLAAAAGPRIYVFDGATGQRLSSWPSSSSESQDPAATNGSGENGASEPREKRRKLSPSPSEAPVYPGPSEDGEPGTSRTAISVNTPWSSISILGVSNKGHYIVAVTAEDKCIRVFEAGGDGKLLQLSSRPMPKRPSALSFTSDDSTILIGDKFGDVYSLPLVLTDDPIQSSKKKTALPRYFRPSASALTVHTGGNRRALEQQLKYSVKESPKAEPEPAFEYKPLLGHVSMLTDVTFVSLPPSGSGLSRDYILTSDRDEHIRISRGPPQAHIIEGYCLGHTAFVTKLCVPQWDRKLLISGGGDDYILVWDWLQCRILQKIGLRGSLQAGDPPITVAGIWAVPFEGNPDLQAKATGAILVALEGVPTLFPFLSNPDSELVPQNPVELPGNLLDVTASDKSGQILVSVDNIHEPGSTKDERSTSGSRQRLLVTLKLSAGSNNSFNWEEVSNQVADNIAERGICDISDVDGESKASKPIQAFREMVYSSGNLRKRGEGEP